MTRIQIPDSHRPAEVIREDPSAYPIAQDERLARLFRTQEPVRQPVASKPEPQRRPFGYD